MRTQRNLVLTLTAALLLLAAAAAAPAQEQSASAQMQALRAELEVVSELGRLLGFILRMQNEAESLALNGDQLRSLWQLTEEIRRSERLTPERAEQMILRIEDEILEPRQLMYTDQQFLNREETRVPGSGPSARGAPGSSGSAGSPAAGSPGGDGSSSGTIATYAAGGPYNPLLDTSRQLGQDFEALSRLLQAQR